MYTYKTKKMKKVETNLMAVVNAWLVTNIPKWGMGCYNKTSKTKKKLIIHVKNPQIFFVGEPELVNA